MKFTFRFAADQREVSKLSTRKRSGDEVVAETAEKDKQTTERGE
jgi:hypothetical protein